MMRRFHTAFLMLTAGLIVTETGRDCAARDFLLHGTSGAGKAKYWFVGRDKDDPFPNSDGTSSGVIALLVRIEAFGPGTKVRARVFAFYDVNDDHDRYRLDTMEELTELIDATDDNKNTLLEGKVSHKGKGSGIGNSKKGRQTVTLEHDDLDFRFYLKGIYKSQGGVEPTERRVLCAPKFKLEDSEKDDDPCAEPPAEDIMEEVEIADAGMDDVPDEGPEYYEAEP